MTWRVSYTTRGHDVCNQRVINLLIITSGEPAGIGPDIILKMAQHDVQTSYVVLGDKNLFKQRAKQLNIPIILRDYLLHQPITMAPNTLWIWHVSLKKPVTPGVLNPDNADYVMQLLQHATNACMQGVFDAVVTAPIHKGVIIDAGFTTFTGHTEYFAELSNTPQVVMMLASDKLRVALVTTHLPLRDVADAITPEKLEAVIHIIAQYFRRITVCGLNPHAGEGGHLGAEERDIIEPTLHKLRAQYNLELPGPFPADSVFIEPHLSNTDVFLAMYHDQGLAVLKYASFDEAANITLGLPFIRTSVDHGTALSLAGTGRASEKSLVYAVKAAMILSEPFISSK